MNPALYHLIIFMATCKVTDAITYTMGVIAELSPVKNCRTILAMEVFPAASVFRYNF